MVLTPTTTKLYPLTRTTRPRGLRLPNKTSAVFAPSTQTRFPNITSLSLKHVPAESL